ncbi:MAG: hypothetical protein GY868_02625 [Deltaproteobacteria bacterium]|nr:hypothetical protein [Deltaproteobacteria bacterium]
MLKRYRNKANFLFSALSCFFLLILSAGGVNASRSENYILSVESSHCGGGHAASENFLSFGFVGQTVAEQLNSTSNNYTLRPGIMCALTDQTDSEESPGSSITPPVNDSGGGDSGGGNPTTTTMVPASATTTIPNMNPVPECTGSADCDDGAYCNGAEKCIEGVCAAGEPPCNNTQLCSESPAACLERITISVISKPRTIKRPTVFKRMLRLLVLECSAESEYGNGTSDIILNGAESASLGVQLNPLFKPLKIGTRLIVPLSVDRHAATGQWSITITTKGDAENLFEEYVSATFYVE